MNKSQFIQHVQDLTGLSENMAETGTAIVLGVLSHRLTNNEAEDAEAQLPIGVKDMWNDDRALNLFQKLFTQQLNYRNLIEFYSLVDSEIEKENLPVGAGNLVEAVFHTVKHQLDEGEIADISANLPEEIREIWEQA